MTPDEELLELLREKVHSPGVTDEDRQAFKAQSKVVADARQATKIAEEQAGRRLGPNTPPEKRAEWESALAGAVSRGDAVASPETASVSTGVNEDGGAS